MMGLNEDWLLCSSSSQSAARNLLISACDSSSSPSSKESPPEKRSEGVVDPSSEDYNPPSMETNVADLEDEKESSDAVESSMEDGGGPIEPNEFLENEESGTSRERQQGVMGPFLPEEGGALLSEEEGEDDEQESFLNTTSSSTVSTSSRALIPGVVGLRNVGNTCYMNAGLQCLLASPPLISHFGEKSPQPRHEEERESAQALNRPAGLSASFSTLLSRVWKGSLRVLKPAGFKESLSSSYPQFKGSHQHDCQEFLALLLDSLHEELKRKPSSETSSTKPLHPTSSSYSSSSASPDSAGSSSDPGPGACESQGPPEDPHLTSIRHQPLPLDFHPVRLDIEDYYLKENKTSNVNVNADDGPRMNNAVSFDSEKYASREKSRLGGGGMSFNNNLSGKRYKETNLYPQRSPSLDNNAPTNRDIGDKEIEEFSDMKRMRLDASEKNKKAPQLSCGLNNASELKEALEADTVWEKYLSENESIIAKSFHGQFKNKVVCSVCEGVSVTFEPFMYLSVPLPGAINKEITLTFIRNGSLPLRLRLTLTQVDKVGDLKTKLREVLSLGQERKIQVVEVFDHHISRFLEDWTSLKFLKEDREIYALEVVEKVFEEEEEVEDEDPMGSSEECILASQDYQTCIICMEDLPPSDLRQHNACDCVLCLSCMDRTIEHHQKEEDSSLSGQIKCPGCRLDADPVSEFLPLDKVSRSLPKRRILSIPLVYRLDHSEEEDNNKKNVETLGHPFLLSLSNIVSGKKLYELLDPLVRVLTPEDYSLVLVNAQGKKCARCNFHAHCYGCNRLERLSSSRIYLQPSDTLGISFRGPAAPRVSSFLKHESLLEIPKAWDRLGLSECLSAFSEKEVLDENNPWFCSSCQKNQCATKTLTIWRAPDFLIIYLKRFVYLSGSSGAVKLEIPVDFPLSHFDLREYLSGPLPQTPPSFDLYGIVNHFGSVCGGHYTSFTRKDSTWNYFDDSSVSEKKVPGSSPGDFSSAYVLFYKRTGVVPSPKNLHQDLTSRIITTKFNLDSPPMN